MLAGSEVLTAYVMAVSHEVGLDDPGRRATSGWRRACDGSSREPSARRSALPTADLSIRKLAALEALSRYGKAEPRLLGSVTIEPNLWPTSAVLDWWSLLHRVPGIPPRGATARGRADRPRPAEPPGDHAGLLHRAADDLWWLMVSADVNAVRLDPAPPGGRRVARRPAAARPGRAGRQQRGAWDLTVANAWGVLAVEKFSRTFEKTPVSGTSHGDPGRGAEPLDWAAAPKGGDPGLPLARRRVGDSPWSTRDRAALGDLPARAAIPLPTPLRAATGSRGR